LKECPYCSQLILDVAGQCRFCGRELSTSDPAELDWQPFLRRYAASRSDTQRLLWRELSKSGREYVHSRFGISPPAPRAGYAGQTEERPRGRFASVSPRRRVVAACLGGLALVTLLSTLVSANLAESFFKIVAALLLASLGAFVLKLRATGFGLLLGLVVVILSLLVGLSHG